MSKKTHQFDSKVQMAWAFATKKPWAKRWGENTELAGRSKTMVKRKKPPTSAYRSARSLMARGK